MRRVTLELASIANGASSLGNVLSTPDDNKDRVVRHIWASPATIGAVYTLRKGGLQIAQIDAARFAAGNWPVEVNETWPATIQITVDILNTTGAGYAPAITISYDTIPPTT